MENLGSGLSLCVVAQAQSVRLCQIFSPSLGPLRPRSGHNATHTGEPRTGAEVAGVVHVHTVCHGAESQLVSQFAEDIEELRLAVVTTVRLVGPIAGIGELLGRNESMRNVELRGDSFSHGTVTGGIGRGHRGYGQRVVAQESVSRVREITGVHTTREGDQDSPRVSKRAVECDLFGAEIRGVFHGAKVRGGYRGVKRAPGVELREPGTILVPVGDRGAKTRGPASSAWEVGRWKSCGLVCCSEDAR